MSNSTSANKIPDDTWSYSVETNIENSEIHSYFSTVQARTKKVRGCNHLLVLIKWNTYTHSLKSKIELVTCTNEYRKTDNANDELSKDVMEKSLFFDESHESDLVESIDEFSLREEMTLPASENSKKKNQRQDGFWKSISEKFMSYQNNISKTRRIITLLGNFRLDTRESPWMQSFPRTKLTKLHKILLIMSNGLHNLFLNTFKNISILITIHLRLRGLKTIQRLKTST
uniref:Uncharacterized protein n=1 Tax=Rhizophagus irregularis (strain DAOM 181602 / DAOM 197198 / MUCL 43194) TaxID=747089 RepID=U9U7C9_RHIID